MDSLTSFHKNISDFTSFLNFLLFIELTIAFVAGVVRGWMADKVNVSKIAVLAAITTILFCVQSWPSEIILFTRLLQSVWIVFAGGLLGCILRWVEN